MGRCRWVKDQDVPNGRFLVPGCINRAVHGDLAECHCGADKETIGDKLQAIVGRLEAIETKIARAALAREGK